MQRSTLYRCVRLAITLLAAIAVVLAVTAGAEETDEAFIGYFTETKYLRVEPVPDTRTVTHVPAGTRLRMIPVSDRYALTEYNGQTGYIFYGDVVIEDAEDVWITPYFAYSREVLFAYGEPHGSAQTLAVYPAYTPFWVIGRNNEFAIVQTEAGPAYILRRNLSPLPEDDPVEPYAVYVDQPVIAYERPLMAAAVAAVLTPPKDLTVDAQNGDFLRVTVDGMPAYVLRGEMLRRPQQQSVSFFCTVPAATVYYEAADNQSFTKEYLPAHTIVEVDETGNGFSRIKDSGLYVKSSALTRLYPGQVEPFYAYWEEDQPLYANTTGTLLPTGLFLPGNTLVTLDSPLGNFYLVRVEGGWGFVRRDGMCTLDTVRSIQATAALTRAQTTLRAQPLEFAPVLETALPPETPLWLDEMVGAYYRVTWEDTVGYAPASAFSIIGENEPVRAFEAYFAEEAQLSDFPYAPKAQPTGTLPANTLARVVAQNGSYYYIQQDALAGYVSRDAAHTVEDAQGAQSVDGRRYYLLMNKASKELTIYHADTEGRNTGEVYKTIVVAIGKRTTPTPSGIFSLGGKERWHYFGPSYAPFAIAFTPGRYLHGPLYFSNSETSLIQSRMEDFGTMATGGCIRIPYDDALWIYFHCMTEETTLEIINGTEETP